MKALGTLERELPVPVEPWCAIALDCDPWVELSINHSCFDCSTTTSAITICNI